MSATSDDEVCSSLSSSTPEILGKIPINISVNRICKVVVPISYTKDENVGIARTSSSQSNEPVPSESTTSSKSTCVLKSGQKSFIEPKLTALYVGELHDSVKECDLRKMFKDYPSLHSIKICNDSTSGKPLGYGYVNFSNEQQAIEAMENYNYTVFKGKEIRIMPSLRNSNVRKNLGTNVYFSNLPTEDTFTTRSLYKIFSKYGKILSCKLDRRKNIAFVYFERQDVAEKVIQKYNRSKLLGKDIYCGLHFSKELREKCSFEEKKTTFGDPETILQVSLDVESVKLEDGTNPNTIFAKNLPLNVQQEDVLDFFSISGPVKSVHITKVPKYKFSWVFVSFKKISDADNAVKTLDKTKFENMIISVTKATRKCPNGKATTENKVLYLSNLDPIVDRKFIKLVATQHKIFPSKISIVCYDLVTHLRHGLVEFRHSADAELFFSIIDNKLIGGYKVHASWERQKSNVFDIPSVIDHFSVKSIELKPGNSSNSSSCPSTVTASKAFIKRKAIDNLTSRAESYIDFLKFPTATRKDNLRCIVDYVIAVYWDSKVEDLNRFVATFVSKPSNEDLLRVQVHQAIQFLGFER